ncbi:hypothetical protein [Pseudorhodoplanes sp.]|uniref:hypothetical protein n=1 Tax=Pseudorhodoplanes sp. TaxID=1934341 RepID=UPI002BDF458C|nr:hypothetical protein [Pseudorhodoplanes sp.]HWV53530.1 hypothetical protein [Pseudorhodoplanes sp.]
MAHDPGRHGRTLRSSLIALGLGASLCACAQEPKPVITTDPNTPPANYKADILAYLRTYLNDPSGVRGAYIAEPELRNVPGSSAQRYMACLRFNAKDSTGKYEGSRDRMVAFLSGRLDTIMPARKEQCDQANWQPFPELEKLKR